MLLIFIVVFLGVFAIVALLLLNSGLVPSRTQQQAQATLDSALKSDTEEKRQIVLDLKKSDSMSSIPWLNQRLQALELTPYLRRMLSQAAIPWSAGRLMVDEHSAIHRSRMVVLSVRAAYCRLHLESERRWSLAPYGWVMLKRSRRFGKFEKGLPEALDLMVSGLRAGHSLLAAIALVSRECADPIGVEFKICFEEQNYGLEMKAALENLLTRVPLQDLKIVSTAILIQKESGGNLAEVLDKASYVIRERFRLKRQIMTHTAQGRLTGMILACLPVVLGVAIYFVDPDMMSILWHRDVGIKLIWDVGVYDAYRRIRHLEDRRHRRIRGNMHVAFLHVCRSLSADCAPAVRLLFYRELMVQRINDAINPQPQEKRPEIGHQADKSRSVTMHGHAFRADVAQERTGSLGHEADG